MATTTARNLTYGQKVLVGLTTSTSDVYTVASIERGRQRNRHVINVKFQELASTGRPYRTTFGLNDPVTTLEADEVPAPEPIKNPYVEKYGGAPDDPAFVGQVIDSGGEIQFLPDGTVILSEFHGHTYRPVQRLHRSGRDVIVSRRDGSTITIPEEKFTTTDRDLSALKLRVVYVPEV